MAVNTNENPKHGVSLGYIKSVRAIDNAKSRYAAREGGISLDYISNITSEFKNRKGMQPAEISAASALPVVASTATVQPVSSETEKSDIDITSRLKALANQVNNTANLVAEKQTNATTQQPNTETQSAEVNGNTDNAIKNLAVKGTLAVHGVPTGNGAQSYNRTQKQAVQNHPTEKSYENLNALETVRQSVSSGTFNANQDIDWETDSDGSAVSTALSKAIAEEKKWQSEAGKKYKNLDNDLSVYGYQVDRLGKSSEEAYEQMVFTCYPDGDAPYKSVQEFQNIVLGLAESEALVKNMESALEERISVEKIEKANHAAQSLEQAAQSASDFQSVTAKGLGGCKEDMWDPFQNENFKKSFESFAGGSSSNYHADKGYKEDVQEFEDSLENPIAYIEKYRDEIQDESEIHAWTDGASLRNAGIATPEYMYFTESEKLVYTYYIETQGREKADEYMQSIMHKLIERRERFRAENNGMENIADWAEKNDFLAGVVSIPTNLVGGIASAVGMVIGEEDKQSGVYYLSNVTNAMREGATRDDSEVGAFFANTAMSIGDNLIASAFGPYAAPAIMGSTATGNAYNSAIQNGSSEEEAAEYAVLTGLIEWGTEKIPFDKLIKLSESGITFSKSSMKQAVGAILGQAGTEAAEETVNSYASTLMDISVRGDNSDYKQYIQALIARGMTAEEAEKEANRYFFIIQPLESAAAGSVSGGVLSTGQTAVNTVSGNFHDSKVRAAAEKLNNGETLSVSEKKTLLASDINDRKTFAEVTGVSLGENYSVTSVALDTASERNARKNAEQRAQTDTETNAPTAQTVTPEQSAGIDVKLAALRSEVEASAQNGITNNYADALESARDIQERRYGADTVRNAALSANVLTDNKNTLLKGRASSMGQGGITLPVRDGESITTIARNDIAERRNGVVGGVSQNISAQLDAVELIGAAIGVPIYLYDGDSSPIKGHSGEAVNGFTYRNPETGKAEYIALDINSDAPLMYLIGHEVFHAMGRSSEQKLTKYISEYMDEKLTVEEAANKLGECLCEPAFCEYLVNKNRSLAQRILSFIKNLIARLKGQDVQQLNSMQKTLANALNKAMQGISQTGESENDFFSIARRKDNTPVVVIEDNILQGVPKENWVKTVKNIIKNKFSDGIPIGGRLIKVNIKSRDEFTMSRDTRHYRAKNEEIYEDKLKSSSYLDEIVLASTDYINEVPNHERKDNFTEFARGNVLMRIGGKDYSAKVIVGYTKGREMVLYDVIDFLPTVIDDLKIKKADMSSPSNIESNSNENSSNISTDNSIPNSDDDVNSFMSRSSYTDIGNGVQIKTVNDEKRANRNKKFAAERDLINRIARHTHIKVQYVSSMMQNGKELTGGCYYHYPSSTVCININSDKALTAVFSLGLLYHIAENDTRFVQTTYNYLREFGKDAGWSGEVISQINEILLKRTDTARPYGAFEEVLADKVAEMFEDENFMRYVSRKNMTFLQKLWENIKNFIIRSLGGTYTPPDDVINAKTAEEIIGKMSKVQVLVADALDRVSHDRTRAAAQAAKAINKQAKKLDGKYAEYNGEAYSENEWQGYKTDKVEHKDITVKELRSKISKMPDAILKTLAREMGYDFKSTTSAGRKIEFAENVLNTLNPDDVISVPGIPYREGDISPLTSKEQKENVSALKKTGGSIKTVRKYGYQKISDGVTIYVADPSKVPLSNAHRDNIAGAKSLAAALGFESIGYYTGEIRNVDGKEVKTESRSLVGEDGTLYLNLNADSPYTSIVGAAWFENLRKSNTMTAVALVKAYDRYRKLINTKTDISQWIGKQLTSTQRTDLFTGNILFTQELSRFMHMNASEILSTVESDPQFSSLIARADMPLAEKMVDSIKGFFTKFGDIIAHITGNTERRAASALTIAQKNLLIAMRDAPIDGARAMRNEQQRAAEYRRLQNIEREIERIDRLEAERERAAQRERAERRREYYEELDRQEAEKKRVRENRRRWNWGDIPDGEGGDLNSFMSRSVDNENGESYNQSRGDNNGRRKGKVFRETREAFESRARKEGLRGSKEIKPGVACRFRIPPSGLLSQKGKEARRELKRLGINNIVFSELIMLNNGEKTKIASGDSMTIDGKIVAVGISEDEDYMEHIGHEAFHVWYESASAKSYGYKVLDGIVLGDTFDELFRHINENYFNEEFDAYSEADQMLFNEELIAHISGMIHSGQDISGLCKDPDAVIEAWNKLVEEHVAKASDDNSFMSRGGNNELDSEIAKLDAEYMIAVESGDVIEQERLVEAAARAAGYDTPKLYHGTRSFGFTEFDLEKGENLIFATSDVNIAKTYSEETDRNRIHERNSERTNIEKLKGEELLSKAKEMFPQYKDYVAVTKRERLKMIEYHKKGLDSTIKKAKSFLDLKGRKITAHQRKWMNKIIDALRRMVEMTNANEVGNIWREWAEADFHLQYEIGANTPEGFLKIISNEKTNLHREMLKALAQDGDAYVKPGRLNAFDFVREETIRGMIGMVEVERGIYELYGKKGRQLVVDAKGESWHSIKLPDEFNVQKEQRTREVAKTAKDNGYDSVLIKNVYDVGGGTRYSETGDIYIFFSSDKVKSADPITYDDNGDIIPLSKRFSEDENDIRFMSRKSYTPRKVPAAEVIESIERFEYDEDTLRSIASQIFSDSTDMTAEELYDSLPDIIDTLLEENPSLTFDIGNRTERTGSSLGRGLDELLADNAEAVEKAVGRFEHQPEIEAESQTLEDEPAPIINDEPEVRSGYQELRDRFGTIPQGEDVNSRGDVGVPRRTQKNNKVRQGVRTFAEAKATPDEVVGELEREILNGTFSYIPLSDKAASNYAREMVESDPEEALKEWDAVVRGTKPATKKQIALAENLIVEAATLGDTDTAVRLIAEVAAEGTRAGQAVQAFRMIKKLSPMGQLYSLQKAIDKLNRENENRGVKIELPAAKLEEYAKLVRELEDLQRRIAELEKELPGSNEKGRLRDELDSLHSEAERKKKVAGDRLDKLKDDVAEQMPKKWTEKFNAWRYLAMLGNPRTHIRNILGNAVFAPTVTLKSKLAAVMEAGVKKINPKFERSQALMASKAVKEFAMQDAKEYLKQLSEGGKYNASDAIRDQQKVFSERNPIGKVLNKAAAFNSALLEIEDAAFLRTRYAYALAHYCAANRWNVKFLEANPQKLQQAREFAFHEAQRATYRDMNAFSQFLSQASNKLRDGKGFSRLAYWAMEGALPFKKTPANIIKRGVEYSPLGLLNTLAVDIFRLKNGTITGAEYINNLAAGMTGTMVLGLGYLLASLGILRGRSKDKEDEFEELRGAQEWSVVIGDFSYTIDWLAPMSLPLFVGVELYDQTANTNDEMNMQDMLDSLTAIAEPIFSLSMMDGVSSILQSYSSEGAISDMFISALQSYIGQMTPTVLGQIARTVDDTSRNAYYNDKTSWWSNAVMQPIRGAMSKIPVANQQLPARVDAWGRTTEGTTTVGERLLQNFISPGYWSFDKTSPVDEEIQKIYDEIGDEGILPKAAPKYFSINGETYYLSSEEYVNFAIDRGQTAYAIIEELINNKTYKSLSAAERASAIEEAYSIALDYAKGNTESGFNAESNKAIRAFNESGVEYSDYILFSVLCTGTSQADAYKALNKMRYLTESECSALWNTKGWKTSYKEYKAEH